jgi:hypothetical protein
MASTWLDQVSAATAGIAPRIMPAENFLDYTRLLDNETQAVAFGQKTIERAVNDFFAAAERL